jgi:spectinomycin phosphotransferase
MLEKPAIPEEKISACLREEFGLQASQIDFLPLGADLNTVVYRVLANESETYFLKLRQGRFYEIAVELPKFLGEQGIREIIVPMETVSGKMWANIDEYKAILYPFIEGQDGYEKNLSESQWVELGQTFKRIHSMRLPARLEKQIRGESYSPLHRLTLQSILEEATVKTYGEPLSRTLVGLLKKHASIIWDLIERAERLADLLQNHPAELCLCHGDLHAGNVLIEVEGKIHLVDWDDPIRAMKERDLMSIGASLFGNWREHQEEEALFYEGYGQAQIDQTALAYYRCERVIEDMAIECQQIFSAAGSKEDREQALKFFESNFRPNNTIELAKKTPEH